MSFDWSVWGIVTHVLASLLSEFCRTSNIWQSSITINQQKFFDEPRFTWIQFYYGFALCPMTNLQWPIWGHYNIFFPLSYRAILFTLSEKIRARDKVYFDWEIYRTITFETSKIKQVIYKNGAHVFRSARNLCAIRVNSFIKCSPTALYRWWFASWNS